MWFVIYSRFLQIFQSRQSVVPPQLFQFVDLVKRDLSRPELFLFGRDLDEPRQEGTIFDQGRPLSRVPHYIFRRLHRCTRLSNKTLPFPHQLEAHKCSSGRIEERRSYLQSKTTTVSDLAGMKPKMKTFFAPHA